MSLVITSSNQDKYDVKSMGMGLEQPARFQNNLSSSLLLPTNSEVSVQSVKFQREGYTFMNGYGFLIYFGDEMSAVGDQDLVATSTQRPILIPLDSGTYSQMTLRQHIEDRMTEVIKQTYPNVKNIQVALKLNGTTSDFEGFTWTLDQYGSSSGYANAIDDWTPQINASTIKPTLNSFTDDNPDEFLAEFYTDNFDQTTGGTTLTFDKTKGSGEYCSAIGTTYPIGVTNGVCEFDITGLNGNDSGFLVGMTRPLTTDYVDEVGHYNQIPWGRTFREDSPFGTDWEDGEGYTPNNDGTSQNQFLWCDYGVYWKNGDHLLVVESNAVGYAQNGGETPFTSMDSIRYWSGANQPASVITNASMEAGFYDRVKFDIVNEDIYVSMRETKAGTYQKLLNASITTAGLRFKPLGLSTQSLYPSIMLERNGDAITLASTTTSMALNDQQVYNVPRTYGFEGDGVKKKVALQQRGINVSDFAYYTSYFGQEQSNKLDNLLDTSSIYQITVGSSVNHTYKGVNGSDGQGYHWTMIFGEGQNYTDVPVIREWVNTFTAAIDQMGFSVAIINQSQYGTVTSHNKVAFSSTKTPSLANTSLFVRLMDFTQDSYNAGKGSVSKILYHCPRFDNEGNTSGPMFFEPHEKTYVKLNNAAPIMVSTLKVEICDQEEKVAEDLRGNTIVVFHFRESESKALSRNTSGAQRV